MCCDRIFLNTNLSCHNPHQYRKDPADTTSVVPAGSSDILGLPSLLALTIDKASTKPPVSLGHDNDRLTACCNLACAAEHVSLIFAGSRRDHLTLPSRLLRNKRNKRSVFRVLASRQVETTRNTSPFLHHLNTCHTSPLSNALQQQILLLLREQTLLLEKPGGLFI